MIVLALLGNQSHPPIHTEAAEKACTQRSIQHVVTHVTTTHVVSIMCLANSVPLSLGQIQGYHCSGWIFCL